MLGVAILGWIVHKFIINPYILKPFRKKKKTQAYKWKKKWQRNRRVFKYTFEIGYFLNLKCYAINYLGGTR